MKTVLSSIIFSFLSYSMYSQIQLWGMTYSGGKDNGGVIFRLDEAGNNPQLEYEFPNLDFVDPYSNKMIQAADGMLYGLATGGGRYNEGVLFQYNPSTLQYTVKFSFKNETGSVPFFLMQAKDGMLYGLTEKGGLADEGVLFQYNLQTNSYTKKFDFNYLDGIIPTGFMQASNGMLYGMTYDGGDGDGGVLFEFNPFQSTYTKKIDFIYDSILLRPASLFIQTPNGMLHALFRDDLSAAMFEYDPVHGTFTKKLDLPNLNSLDPASLLLAKDGLIYGTSFMGGNQDKGFVFQYNPLTSKFAKTAEFNGLNGSNPLGSLIEDKDGMIYGMATHGGGIFEYDGVVFQYNPATSALIKKVELNSNNEGELGYNSMGFTLGTDGKFYGMGSTTHILSGGGSIFRFDPSAATYSVLLNTMTSSLNGKAPTGSLLKAKDNLLYGLCSSGGTTDSGTLFQYNPLNHAFTKKFDFGGSNGASPYGSLMQATDGMMYGMATYGGIYFGTLFSYDPSTSSYEKKIDFGINPAVYFPTGSLIQATDGMLYGMIANGGEHDLGTLFKYQPAFNDFTNIYHFTDDAKSGNSPVGSLIQAKDGMFYGLTSGSGERGFGNGVLFRYNSVTDTYNYQYSFDDPLADIHPIGSLVEASDGMLYGMTDENGNNRQGFLFQYNPLTNVLTKQFHFDGINGSHPIGSLVQGSNGMLYGMTYSGGTHDMGVVFQFDPKTGSYTKKLDFNGQNGAYPRGNLIEINTAVGIAENQFSDAIHIFPNPGTGIFNLQMEVQRSSSYGQIKSIEVVTVLGERVAEIRNLQATPDDTGFYSHVLNLSHLSSGIYFVNVKTENGTGTKKVIKQ